MESANSAQLFEENEQTHFCTKEVLVNRILGCILVKEAMANVKEYYVFLNTTVNLPDVGMEDELLIDEMVVDGNN